MKTLGLIGGMSWESTVPYYRTINEHVKRQLGGLHSARLFLHSVDFYDIEKLQAKGIGSRLGKFSAMPHRRWRAPGLR
ncbi:putative racemase [Ewingella americana]|uniref:Putative racemase n=1 Tax=Ewingella americana TaxID=41202 RepID=A0A377NCK2_9GAMM|nr:putative racemase [Ewingella americana]